MKTHTMWFSKQKSYKAVLHISSAQIKQKNAEIERYDHCTLILHHSGPINRHFMTYSNLSNCINKYQASQLFTFIMGIEDRNSSLAKISQLRGSHFGPDCSVRRHWHMSVILCHQNVSHKLRLQQPHCLGQP
jgi:hypothetical protein